MCGFTGFLGVVPIAEDGTGSQVLHKMTDAIRHRGPDSDGHWYDNAAGIALGHRRLAIVDLSNAGAQPMESISKRRPHSKRTLRYGRLAMRTRM